MKTVTAAERPDLVERAWRETIDSIPEYNHHGDVINAYWSRLTDERPEFQFFLLDEGDEILARGHSLPVRWDGSIEDLPAGIDGAIARGFDEGGENALCAMLIAVPRNHQGRGLSAVAVSELRGLAARHGLSALIAPVRPNWKERYPLVPIERYATWRRADGLLFDPWMRVHERAGATILEARAAFVADHRNGRRVGGMDADGVPRERRLLVPGRAYDRRDRPRADVGSYWEPNVWMRHAV